LKIVGRSVFVFANVVTAFPRKAIPVTLGRRHAEKANSKSALAVPIPSRKYASTIRSLTLLVDQMPFATLNGLVPASRASDGAPLAKSVWSTKYYHRRARHCAPILTAVSLQLCARQMSFVGTTGSLEPTQLDAQVNKYVPPLARFPSFALKPLKNPALPLYFPVNLILLQRDAPRVNNVQCAQRLGLCAELTQTAAPY